MLNQTVAAPPENFVKNLNAKSICMTKTRYVEEIGRFLSPKNCNKNHVYNHLFVFRAIRGKDTLFLIACWVLSLVLSLERR